MASKISAGGIVRMNIAGEVLSIRGSVTIYPTKIERTEGANLDGSVYTTAAPVPQTIEMSISDKTGLRITDLDKLVDVDCTVELSEVGRTLVFINASLIGKPSLDPSSGEISGMKLVAEEMREINE